MMKMKENLVKRVNDPFFVPVFLSEGEKCSARSIIEYIIKEEDLLCNEELQKLEFALEKLLEKIDSVRDGYKNIVNETAGGRVSGRLVGWGLEPHLKKLIPQDLVGGRTNKEKLLKNIRKTFLFGKEDLVPTSLLMDGLVVENVVWLKDFKGPRQQMLTAVVKWLWRVAKLLVASTFFVSNMQAAPNQLVFIPKKLWKSETDRAFNSFTHLQVVSEAKANILKKLRKPAFLRWMPKEDGLRPIMEVREDKSSADIDNAKRFVLNLVRSCHFQVTAKYMHGIWMDLINLHNRGIKLYFVSCDIHDAFGSVNQDKLLEILNEEIIREHGSEGLSKFAREITFIKNAVKCQTVKTAKKYYLLTKGLGQGLALSNQLCNLYLTHLDRTSLSSFTSEPGEKLIRAADDYLYVTPDKSKAERFLETMNAGFVGYGVKINTSKTQTNLDGDKEILYYGYLFNTANMEVSITYNQGLGVHYTFCNSMVFKTAPAEQLEKKLVSTPHMKLNRLTVDSRYMRAESVAGNVLQVGCVLARRLLSILTLCRPADVPPGDQLVQLISRSAEAVAQRVCRARNALKKDEEQTPRQFEGIPFICLRKKEVKWVVIRAYLMILTRAAKMKSFLPGSVVQLISKLDGDAKAEVREQILHLVCPTIIEVPPQFRNVDRD